MLQTDLTHKTWTWQVICTNLNICNFQELEIMPTNATLTIFKLFWYLQQQQESAIKYGLTEEQPQGVQKTICGTMRNEKTVQ